MLFEAILVITKGGGYKEIPMPATSYSFIYLDAGKKVLEARLSCTFTRRGKWHFAKCPELQLVDQGTSRREAIDNLTSMIFETLAAAVEIGKIDDMLHALGFRKIRVDRDAISGFRRSIEKPDSVYPLPTMRIDVRKSASPTLICSPR
jgi:predicted RNase H-like HicB family nuclease